MKESLLKLAKLLAEDENFSQKFSSLKSVDEQYDFAQKSVPGYTKEEFVSFLDELEKSYELKSDISPEEMEKVSGGANRNKVAAMAMLALSAVGSAAPMLTSASGSGDDGYSKYVRGYDESLYGDASESFIDLPTSSSYQGVQSSRIGSGRATSASASKVMRDNEGELRTIENHLDDRQLALFASASACTDKGIIRTQEVERMKKLAQNLETKSAVLNMIMEAYKAEKMMGINWLHFPGSIVSGRTVWGIEYNKDFVDKSKLPSANHEKRIIGWLMEKCKEGYYLYFDTAGDLVLSGETTINLKKDAASYSSEVNTNVESINTFVDELTQRLNRARVIGQSLKAAGMNVEGQWVMRDDKTTIQGTANPQLQSVQQYLNKEERVFNSLNYSNCSSSNSDARMPGRAQIISLLGAIKDSALSKTTFTEDLLSFVNSSDVNWIKVTGRSWGVPWTGWKFNVKSEKHDEITTKAQSGDAYAQVLLWLNARFSQRDGSYFYPSGDNFKLEGSTKGEFPSLYGTDFSKFASAKFGRNNVAAIGEYDEAIQKISRTCNLHRALSGALVANGMKTEANAVMAGTA